MKTLNKSLRAIQSKEQRNDVDVGHPCIPMKALILELHKLGYPDAIYQRKMNRSVVHQLPKGEKAP